MKINLKFNDIKVGNDTSVGNIEVGIQYNPGELVGEYKLFRQVLKELPDMFADLADGMVTVDEMDKAFDTVTDANIANNPELKASAVNNVANLVNNIRTRFTRDSKPEVTKDIAPENTEEKKAI